jgi:lipopolysaccharide transport system ATP-binding protein
MAVIQSLCRRGIFLEHGVLRDDGPVDSVVRSYLQSLESDAVAVDLAARTDRGGWHQITLARLEITADSGTTGTLATGRPATFDFELTALQRGASLSFTVHDQLGHPVATLSSARAAENDIRELGARPRFSCLIDELPLVPGRYRLDVTLTAGGHVQDHLEGAAFFDVAEGLFRGRPVPAGEGRGVVTVPCRWITPEEA